MEKKYVKPAIKVQTLDMDNTLLAGSGGLDVKNPTDLDYDVPGVGGDNNGTHDVAAKQNTFSVWGDEE